MIRGLQSCLQFLYRISTVITVLSFLFCSSSSMGIMFQNSEHDSHGKLVALICLLVMKVSRKTYHSQRWENWLCFSMDFVFSKCYQCRKSWPTVLWTVQDWAAPKSKGMNVPFPQRDLQPAGVPQRIQWSVFRAHCSCVDRVALPDKALRGPILNHIDSCVGNLLIKTYYTSQYTSYAH